MKLEWSQYADDRWVAGFSKKGTPEHAYELRIIPCYEQDTLLGHQLTVKRWDGTTTIGSYWYFKKEEMSLEGIKDKALSIFQTAWRGIIEEVNCLE